AVICTAASLMTANVESELALSLIWAACVIIFVWLIVRVIAWSQSYFVVTGARMIFITGPVARKVITLPTAEINDLSYERSGLGLMFGYGRFSVDWAAEDHEISKINYIPYPEQLYLEICGLLYSEFSGESQSY